MLQLPSKRGYKSVGEMANALHTLAIIAITIVPRDNLEISKVSLGAIIKYIRY